MKVFVVMCLMVFSALALLVSGRPEGLYDIEAFNTRRMASFDDDDDDDDGEDNFIDLIDDLEESEQLRQHHIDATFTPPDSN